jgi:hypothetical protein
MSKDWTSGKPNEMSSGLATTLPMPFQLKMPWHARCTAIYRRLPMSLQRSLRQFWQAVERLPPFVAAIFSKRGLFSADGRQLVVGKFRRFGLSAVPPLARYLQKKTGIAGGCTSCGASCNIMFQCPHWDKSTRLCTVYEDRPNICKLFPITPADIRDRNIVMKDKPCGFTFPTKE